MSPECMLGYLFVFGIGRIHQRRDFLHRPTAAGIQNVAVNDEPTAAGRFQRSGIGDCVGAQSITSALVPWHRWRGKTVSTNCSPSAEAGDICRSLERAVLKYFPGPIETVDTFLFAAGATAWSVISNRCCNDQSCCLIEIRSSPVLPLHRAFHSCLKFL